jgi:serine/threonine-protein kinase
LEQDMASTTSMGGGSGPATDTLPSRGNPESGRRVVADETAGRAAHAPGDLIASRYRLERHLGAGGMGEVWAARHETIGHRVALKILLPYARLIPEIVARFEREAVLLGRVRGRYVPRVIDFFVDPDVGPLLVTELVEGRSLAQTLEAPLSVEAAIDLGIDLASGLSELHGASVVHRDLKPGNVIVRDGDTERRPRAMIIDLGVSRLVEDSPAEDLEPITSADIVVGTVEYMAPEQVLSCNEVTPAADLYALGALLFRAVTGAHVFGACGSKLNFLRTKLTSDAPQMHTGREDSVAVGLAAVVGKALEREPARRYQSARELRDELLRLRSTPAADATVGSPLPGAGDARTPATGLPRGVEASPARPARALPAMMFAMLVIVAIACGWNDSPASEAIQTTGAAPDLAAIDVDAVTP